MSIDGWFANSSCFQGMWLIYYIYTLYTIYYIISLFVLFDCDDKMIAISKPEAEGQNNDGDQSLSSVFMMTY